MSDETKEGSEQWPGLTIHQVREYRNAKGQPIKAQDPVVVHLAPVARGGVEVQLYFDPHGGSVYFSSTKGGLGLTVVAPAEAWPRKEGQTDE